MPVLFLFGLAGGPGGGVAAPGTLHITAGDCDFICNFMGNEAWTLHLDWAGGDGFRAAPQNDWSPIDGSAAGLSRSYGGLTFLRVYEAGHMVGAALGCVCGGGGGGGRHVLVGC